MDDNADFREHIALAILPHVAFDGWIERSLQQGAIDAGFTAATAARAFPGGAIDAVRCWSAWSDRRMLAELTSLDAPAVRARNRVTTAVRLRILVNGRHREAVRRTMALLALPHYVATAAQLIWNTTDSIWHGIGDRATDLSWYTKRALLSSVYVATLLYWLDDESADFVETWSFLDRRIADVNRIHGLRGNVEAVAKRLLKPARKPAPSAGRLHRAA